MTFSGNKNMEILGSMFPEMLSGRKFVDVTLAVEGRRIQCHRVILAAYSSYFSDLLEENPAQHPIIIFSGEIKFWMIQALVEFMYRGEVRVREADFGDLMKCAETLKIQGFNRTIMTQVLNQEKQETFVAEPEHLQIKEIKTEVLDVEDTEFIYPSELIHPENFPRVTDNEPIREIRNSGLSLFMNRSAESVPEPLNPVHVEQKRPKLRQRKTLQNNRTSGKIETENLLMNSVVKTEKSFRKMKKIDKLPFESSPKDFVLPIATKWRSFDQNTMWSAVMEVKNGMAVYKAAQKFNISAYFIRACMKKYGIKSKFEHQRELDEIKTDILNVEEPEFIYPDDFVLPESPPVPHEPDLHQQGTSQKYRIPGEMETENTSMDSEDETENSSWKERKIDEIPFGSPPKDFVLPRANWQGSHDRTVVWTALMSIKNGMSTRKASQRFKISKGSISRYMKKYNIKSQFKHCKSQKC